MKKYLCLFDVHCPAHNKILMDKIFELCVINKFDGLVLGGDFADMFSLGSYNADSLGLLKEWDLTLEYEECDKLLKLLLRALGSSCKEKYYLYGNHEDRYFRELKKGDRAKYGQELTSPTQGLNLINKGFKVFENWMEDEVKIGKLHIFHGYFTNEHVASKVLQIAHKNMMFGHTHRSNTSINGKYGVWNIACLADIQSKLFGYMHPLQKTKWSNQFAIVNVYDEEGNFIVEPITCWDNKFCYNGKIY